jgi:putative hydrolase of HD superfamily
MTQLFHLQVFPAEAIAFRDFLLNLSKMKSIPRSGWLSHDISLQDVESVADHTFSTSAVSMLLADLEVKRGVRVDVEQVLRMALLHDLAESLTFDISRAYLEYMGTRGQAMKREIENAAWGHLVKGIEEGKLARRYANAQREYDENRTIEAKIVHTADSIDVLLQVVNYRRRGYPEALLSDLWKEQSSMVRGSDVPSARSMLKLLTNENRRML